MSNKRPHSRLYDKNYNLLHDSDTDERTVEQYLYDEHMAQNGGDQQ